MVHLSNSKAIVRHASLLIVAILCALLESSVLLGGLCSIHSRLRVLGGPLSRIMLSLLITATSTILLIFRAGMICRCRFVKVSVRDLLPGLIIFGVQTVVITPSISREALILLILTGHGLLEGDVITCNRLP